MWKMKVWEFFINGCKCIFLNDNICIVLLALPTIICNILDRNYPNVAVSRSFVIITRKHKKELYHLTKRPNVVIVTYLKMLFLLTMQTVQIRSFSSLVTIETDLLTHLLAHSMFTDSLKTYLI